MNLSRHESMNHASITIQRLLTVDEPQLHGLTEVLVDGVDSGASVRFMRPLMRDRTQAAVWAVKHGLV